MTPEDTLIVLGLVLGGAVALGVIVALLVFAVKLTGGVIAAIGWTIKHVFSFVFGIIGDIVRCVGAVVAALIAVPFATCNVILGRWDAAGRWGRALRRETMFAGYSVWSVFVRRPLKLLCLDGVLEGVETRLPQRDGALTNATGASADPALAAEVHVPLRADPASFEGYTITGTLRPGGSGAKLYVASPDEAQRRRMPHGIDQVVIKSFALEEGSSLPQIVRESRALDAARSLGLILDHGLDAGRFWYVMPYHAGENLNETTRLLHARSGSDGLTGEDLRESIRFAHDLVATLARYHEGGLWHKDVKPDNIMVHDGRAHLVDLGLVTPLRSAMTLTTHGTEYFRDPEMVRQALRGVRVHQIDGAKFDIYGAGAVLYFMLENTFPSHSGLSAFAKRSPEALRWIVRRSMADYHQRYASAQAMLADVQAVAAASDPWAIKPIELPSMRGVDAGAVQGHGPVWSPPPPPGGFGAFSAGAGAASMAIPVAARPKLLVTNWWTGAYRATGGIGGKAGGASDATAAARAALAAVAAHRAQRRAKPVKPKKERAVRREPPRLASALGVMLAAVVSILVLGKGFQYDRSPARSPATIESIVLAKAMPPSKLKAPAAATKLLIVNDHQAADPAVGELVERVVERYESCGFTMVRHDSETMARLLLALGKERTSLGASDAKADIEAALATGGYWGAVHVQADPANGTTLGSPVERFRAIPIGEQLTKAIEDVSVSRAKRDRKASLKVERGDAVTMPIAHRRWTKFPPPCEPASHHEDDDAAIETADLACSRR
ncbi:MAG: hypothetical protein SGJ11_00915 [Phycisphaerae bacterium]|nr:hypothetical protein [Phycisphaerae bacterium]